MPFETWATFDDEDDDDDDDDDVDRQFVEHSDIHGKKNKKTCLWCILGQSLSQMINNNKKNTNREEDEEMDDGAIAGFKTSES